MKFSEYFKQPPFRDKVQELKNLIHLSAVSVALKLGVFFIICKQNSVTVIIFLAAVMAWIICILLNV